MSETNKFYQYDRNDNNTFGVRGAASGGGTEVKANETLAGTEDSLTELTVGETKYKVDQPINVVANPTLAGTESVLTGLEVGSTKYGLPYLATTGGDVRGNIKLTTNNNGILDYAGNMILRITSSAVQFGTDSKNINFNSNTALKHTISGTPYDVLDSSNTQANPTLAGTETALTGLKVNGTSYKVSGGSLYLHNVYLYDNPNAPTISLRFSLYTTDSTAFTYTTLKTFMNGKGTYVINGFYKYNDVYYNAIAAIYLSGTGATDISVSYVKTDGIANLTLNSSINIIDDISQIM